MGDCSTGVSFFFAYIFQDVTRLPIQQFTYCLKPPEPDGFCFPIFKLERLDSVSPQVEIA